MTALFAIAALSLVLTSRHGWAGGGLLDALFDWGGFVLVMVGVLGRVWSTVYIGGKKNALLVTEGPYSLCRNPLYLFSFIAGLGVCVEFENLILIAFYIAGYSVYYLFVIRSEERRLAGLFGDEFQRYSQTTPAFVPRLSALRLGKLPRFSRGHVLRTLGDASVFPLLLLLAILIEHLHESGVLPTLWTIPW